MMRGLPVLFVLAAGCDSPFGDSPLGIAVTDAEVEAELECAALLYSWCCDADGDGHGTKEGIHPPMAACELLREAIAAGEGVICLPNEEECTNVDRYVNSCDDCDDNSADVYQSTPECDSSRDEIDNDCDGLIDEDHDVTTSYYADADGDTYGDPNSMIEVSSCEDAPDGYDDDNFDCDDGDSAIHPEQTYEGPCGDGIDQNCDGDKGDCALYQAVDVSKPGFNGLSFVGATTSMAWHGLGTDESAYFAVGYPGSVDVEGKVDIYRGEDAGPTRISTLTGDKNSGFGSALAAGDFNNDGVMDLAVGAPNGGQGRVITYFAMSPDNVHEFGARTEKEEVLVGAVLASIGDGSGFAVGYVDQYDGILRQVALVQSFNASGQTSGDDLGDYITVDDSEGVAIWPLALASATFKMGTYLGVGASDGVSGNAPGLALYNLGDSGDALTDEDLTLTDAAGSTSALGASVAFGTLSDENKTSLVLVGSPGTGSVYMLEGKLSGTLSVDETVSGRYEPVWTSTAANSAGSSVAFIGDIDLDGDEELAIGGNDVLWIIAQGESGFPGGDLDTKASGKITGFRGIVRHIVNAGDVDGDGYSDLLISTDSTTYLLYGGYKPAQEDASGTGN